MSTVQLPGALSKSEYLFQTEKGETYCSGQVIRAIKELSIVEGKEERDYSPPFGRETVGS